MKALDAVNHRLFDSKFRWDAIDKNVALKIPHVLDLLHEACLVEAYIPVFTGKMNELFYDDLSATAALTIEGFEAYGHYFTLRRYLEIVGYKPVTDEEVIALRKRDAGKVSNDKVRELVNFMGTEHFAAEFFRDLIQLTEEPVLREILPQFSAEEVVHCQFAYDLLADMLKVNPELKEHLLECALKYQHIGAYVLPAVSPAKEDNLRIIQRFNEKVGQLIGKRLSDVFGDKSI